MKQLPILYTKTSLNQIQQWQIIVDGDSFYTIEGIKNGKLTSSTPTVCTGKNEGKTNETTAEDQAYKEALSKWTKKKDKGYFENISDIDQGASFFEPMLAKKYEDYKDEIKFPVYSQPKLDGCRCIITRKGMFSRNGNQFVSAPHIFEELKPLFDFNPNYVFDGELYADKLNNDFNKIISLAKKTKPNAFDLKASAETLEYHIYDFPFWVGKFSERYSELKKVLSHLLTNPNSKIRLVETKQCHNQKELDSLYGQYLEEEYEGQIIRIDSNNYENKRTKQLLKRKEFIDEEYKILDIQEGKGNRQGMAGNMIFKNKNGEEFSSNIKGSYSLLKEYLVNKKKYVGKLATIKYFNLTPDGIPRFPFVTAIRDYE